MRRAHALRSAINDDSGFTVLEALIATAIVTLIAFTGLAACKTVAQITFRSSAAHSGGAAIEVQATQLRDDAASAFAVFVPAADMYARPNLGQEVDFYSKADDGRAILWRYIYDARAEVLQRWDYDANGPAGVRDVRTGEINARATYPPLRGIVRFGATAIPADRLGDPNRNAYAGIGGLFTHAPRALPVHYPRSEINLADAVGGNGIVQVDIADATAARLIHLVAGSMPTGFTVTGAPLWHAIVYRVDQSHRFLLGAAGKSHVFINAHVDVSYDNWATKIAWCDFNILGNPDGLDGHDPHADYKPDEPIEGSDSILAACRRRHPLPPERNAEGNAPDPDSVHPPLPGQTAPPCWTRPGPTGRCWPAEAPTDWTPPDWARQPTDQPPAAWCATHAASSACAAPRDHPSGGGR